MTIWKEKIIEVLKENSDGLTISEIARETNTTRHTASIALAELRGEGKIKIREVGNAKLHYWGVGE